MSATATGDDARSARHGIGFWAMIAGLLGVVYVLSPGFWVVLWQHAGIETPEWLDSIMPVVYRPIDWATGAIPGVAGFYDWYFAALGIELGC